MIDPTVLEPNPNCRLCNLTNPAEIVRIGMQEPELRDAMVIEHKRHLLQSLAEAE